MLESAIRKYGHLFVIPTILLSSCIVLLFFGYGEFLKNNVTADVLIAICVLPCSAFSIFMLYEAFTKPNLDKKPLWVLAFLFLGPFVALYYWEKVFVKEDPIEKAKQANKMMDITKRD